jgi:hypothetical protein
MKLSLSKKLGWTQVRGGKIVRVAKTHAVTTSGWSAFSLNYADDLLGRKKPEHRFKGEKWVFANEDDLAIEVVVVKTGHVLGHSYLSGPALQLNRYTVADAAWFREASGKLVEIPTPNTEQFTSPQHFIEHVIGMLMGLKYSDDALGAFEYQTASDEEAKIVARHIAEMWGYKRTDDAVSKAHLLGVVHGKKEHINLHFQPPDHASDFAATPFQVKLVLGALRAQATDRDRQDQATPAHEAP